MKKLLVLLVAVLLIATAYASYHAGIRHAIEDSEIWTVTCYNPDNPEESAWNGYDQLIYIELDGELYAHGMYQG